MSLYIIVKDFKFNLRKIKNELSQSLTRGDKEGTTEQNSHQYLSIFTKPSSKLISDKVIGLKIEMCTYADGTVVLKRKGRNIPLKHQFDRIESGFKKRHNGDIYAIGIKNNKRYRIYIVDFLNDRIEEIKESICSDECMNHILEMYYNALCTLIYN